MKLTQGIFSNNTNEEKSQILRFLPGKYCMPTSVITTAVWTKITRYKVRR